MPGPGGELDRREREVLRALVQDYIQTGEPVASQPLLARHELDASPATIRSVMADLEALGFLEKPHASSGRVPTARGYRLYVDTLLKVRPPSPADRDRIEKLAHEASDVTSQLEFVRLRENRVLAVFVSEAGIVTNKLLQLEFPMEAAELERAANYLNEKIHAAASVTSLPELREKILGDM